MSGANGAARAGGKGHAARARRDAVRALKAAATPLGLTRDGAEAILSRPGGGTLRLPGRTIETLVRGGALLRSNGSVVRTPAGEAALRRLLSGAAEPGLDPHAEQHRDRHASTVERDGAREAVTANAMESPLGRLAATRERDGTPFVHPEAIEAGRRLLSDFERAAMRQRVTMGWEMGASTGSTARGPDRHDPTDSAMAARERHARAVAALGDRLGPALVDFACHEMGLTEIERRRGWPARSGKMMLREALERLAAHYRAG